MTERAPAAARDAGPPPGPRRLPSWVRRHRFASSVLALVVFTLVLRLAWGWHSARQLAAALEDLRRRDHPTATSDFHDATVPDEENAWLVYARAIAALKKGVDSPRVSFLEYPPYPPYGPEWEALAAAAERDHAAAFPPARRARRLPNSQFPLRAKDRPRSQSIHWTNARRLANTLADAAEYSHLNGNDAESVERLLDVLHLGRSVRQDPALISQLVGMGIDALALDATQKVVPTLRLDGAGGGTPASSDRARTLIATLLDEQALRESFKESLRRERVVMLDMLRDLARQT